MDRSASSDCSFLKKRRGERNPVRGGTFIDDVVKIFEIDPTSDSSPWGRRASASLQPGETTFDADQTAREFWPGKTPTRAPTLSEFQRYMVERIKAYFQVRWRCVRPLYSVTIWRCSRVPAANPHRFRYTFGADMVQAGIALPALQHLMGHAYIHTTMLYVQLAPQDVWREYARAVQKRISLSTLPTL